MVNGHMTATYTFDHLRRLHQPRRQLVLRRRVGRAADERRVGKRLRSFAPDCWPRSTTWPASATATTSRHAGRLTRLHASKRRAANTYAIASDHSRPTDTPTRGLSTQKGAASWAARQATSSWRPDLPRHLSPARRRRPTSKRNGPGRALRGDSNIQRGRLPPAHRHVGSATPGPAQPTPRAPSMTRKTKHRKALQTTG